MSRHHPGSFGFPLNVLLAQENEGAFLMASGTQMSGALNTTLRTFSSLMQRFGVGETNRAASANTFSEPFRMQDHNAVAAQVQATTKPFPTELLVRPDNLSGHLAPVDQPTQARAMEIVDYPDWKGIILLITLFVATLLNRVLSVRPFAITAKPISP